MREDVAEFLFAALFDGIIRKTKAVVELNMISIFFRRLEKGTVLLCISKTK